MHRSEASSGRWFQQMSESNSMPQNQDANPLRRLACGCLGSRNALCNESSFLQGLGAKALEWMSHKERTASVKDWWHIIDFPKHAMRVKS